VGAPILVRDLHHQPQVGLDESPRCVVVAVLVEADRVRVLLLGGEQGVAPGLGHVRRQRIALDEGAALALGRVLRGQRRIDVVADVDDLGGAVGVVVGRLGVLLAVVAVVAVLVVVVLPVLVLPPFVVAIRGAAALRVIVCRLDVDDVGPALAARRTRLFR